MYINLHNNNTMYNSIFNSYKTVNNLTGFFFKVVKYNTFGLKFRYNIFVFFFKKQSDVFIYKLLNLYYIDM